MPPVSVCQVRPLTATEGYQKACGINDLYVFGQSVTQGRQRCDILKLYLIKRNQTTGTIFIEGRLRAAFTFFYCAQGKKGTANLTEAAVLGRFFPTERRNHGRKLSNHRSQAA